MKNLLVLFLAMSMLLAMFTGCQPAAEPSSSPTAEELAYQAALELIEEGKYAEARQMLLDLRDYPAAEKLLNCFVYRRDQQIRCKEIHRDSGEVIVYEFRSEYTYDENGNVVLELYYGTDGQQQYRLEYQYDDRGNVTHYYEYSPDKSIVYLSQILQYNEHGSVVHQIYYSNRGNSTLTEYTEISLYEYEYDDYGRVIEKRRYREDGSLVQTLKWSYDEHDNIIRYESGLVTSTYTYTYDDSGRVLQKIRYSSGGSIYSTVDYTYDAMGNVTSETELFHSNQRLSTTITTYDEYGFPLTVTKTDTTSDESTYAEYTYIGVSIYFNPNLD